MSKLANPCPASGTREPRHIRDDGPAYRSACPVCQRFVPVTGKGRIRPHNAPAQMPASGGDGDLVQFTFDAKVTDGVPRWLSNGSVPPTEILADWARLGLPFDYAKALEARDRDLRRIVADYRAAQARRTPEEIAEERAEMLAAFGPGETVVNVLTGERTQL